MRVGLLAMALCGLCATVGCGGDDGPPRTPYQEELTQAAEACLREAKCLGREVDLTTCIKSYTTLAARYGREGVLDCVTAAGAACPALLACLNDGMPAEVCEPPLYVASCDSGSPPVYHGCADGFEYSVICRSGTTCESAGGPIWPCGVAPCQTGMTPPTCDPSGQLLECEQAVLVPSDCADGLVCESGACVAPGPGCNTVGGMRCDANVLTYCVDNKQATRDCAVSGHVCGVVAGAPACTTGPAAEACTERGLTATCQNTSMNVCDDGNAYTFACGTNGFACCGVGL